MPFRNPIMGGGVLVRNSMQSENFVTGSTGWIIRRDGTWEFSNGVVRGDLIVSDPSGSQVEVTATGGFAEIQLQPPNSATPGVTFSPAVIVATSFGDSPALEITGPAESTPTAQGAGKLTLKANPGVGSFATLEADFVVIGDPIGGVGTIRLRTATVVNGELSSDIDGMTYMRGLADTQLCSTVGAATTFTTAVVFSTPFPPGVVPVIPAPNLMDGSAVSQLWSLRATSISNTGFTILGSRGGAAVTLTNVPVMWVAMVVS